METNSVKLDHDGNWADETSSEQLDSPDSPGLSNAFGDPLVQPRIGNEFQLEIPPMVTNTADVPHSYLTGLPIPIMWIHDKETEFHSYSSYEVNENRSSESKNRKKSQISSGKKDKKLKVEPLDDTKVLRSRTDESTIAGRSNFDKIYRSKTYSPVPGSLGEAWSDTELGSFLLGLYIFGKNLVQVKRFMDSKSMGEILTFYYGKFYRSDRYRRWTDCKKMRSRKCIIGQKIFTGWRQQELLARLLPHVSDEFHGTLLEVSKTFAEGRVSLEEYVFTLKATVGIQVLIQAIGIGNGKEDLTGLAIEPAKGNQVFSLHPEIPIGKACSSLTSTDIIKLLTGDFRLSKARKNDLFWEAVWPRLLARGWHSEQPNNQGYASSKQYLVFLIPGVKKFLRRKLVKGNHYFDSVTDVLSKVASEPKLLELEAEESGVVEGSEWISEAKDDRDDLSDQLRHCYLKPRVSTCKPKLMKFTVVDTSLIDGAKVRELRCLPVETKESSKRIGPRATEGNSSPDEPDSTPMSLNGQKNTNSTDRAKGSKKRISIKSSGVTKKLVENHQYGNISTSDDKQLKMPMKNQFSRKVRSGNSINVTPATKRRSLSACVKAETSCSMENFSVNHALKPEESCRLSDLKNATNNVSQVGPSQEKVSYLVSSNGGSPQEERSEDIISGNCFTVYNSHEKNETVHKLRPLIDLNLPQVPQDTENDEPFAMEIEDIQRNSLVIDSPFPSDMDEHVEKSEELRTSSDVSTAEKQCIVNPRRQSTRNRPLTTRALEALESGFLSTKKKRKGTNNLTQENPKPPRRARSRVAATSSSRSRNQDTDIIESKEEKGMDGVCNGNTNMISMSLVQTEEKWLTGY